MCSSIDLDRQVRKSVAMDLSIWLAPAPSGAIRGIISDREFRRYADSSIPRFDLGRVNNLDPRLVLSRFTDIYANLPQQNKFKVRGEKSPDDGDWIYWGARMGDCVY